MGRVDKGTVVPVEVMGSRTPINSTPSFTWRRSVVCIGAGAAVPFDANHTTPSP